MESRKQDFQTPAKQPAVKKVVNKVFHGISLPLNWQIILYILGVQKILFIRWINGRIQMNYREAMEYVEYLQRYGSVFFLIQLEINITHFL